MSKTLTTTFNDPEIFDTMGIFEVADTTKNSLSIRLQFAKFAHGITVSDFGSFMDSIGIDVITHLGRLSFPNEWQMTLTSPEIRENLIRLGRTRINNRSCWIHPLSSSEIRGFVHWLPNETPDHKVTNILKNFGEVLFIETQNYTKFNYKIASDARYFALYLKPGAAKEDLPHFLTIGSKRALVTIRGRQPACFHCREVGHRKNECKTYREKLGEYCLRPPGTSGRRGKRGGRHKKQEVSSVSNAKEASDSKISVPDLNKNANEIQTVMQSNNEDFEQSASQIKCTTEGGTAAEIQKKKKSKKKKKKVKSSIVIAGQASAELINNGMPDYNRDLEMDNSTIGMQQVSSTTSVSVLSSNSTTDESFSGICNEEIPSLKFSADTNVPSVLEKENTVLKEEEANVDLCFDQGKNTLDESTEQNSKESVVLDNLKDGDGIERLASFSIENHVLEHVDEKSNSIFKCVNVVESNSESELHEQCSNQNLENLCNDLNMTENMKDSVTINAGNHSQHVSVEMLPELNHQINVILNNFLLEITNVLSDAGIPNVNEIKDKLLAIRGTSLCSNDDESRCNVIQHDKNSNIIDPS